MSLFRVRVVEIVSTPCVYTVEADSPEEALEKAEAGDALSSDESEPNEVLERRVEAGSISVITGSCEDDQ